MDPVQPKQSRPCLDRPSGLQGRRPAPVVLMEPSHIPVSSLYSMGPTGIPSALGLVQTPGAASGPADSSVHVRGRPATDLPASRNISRPRPTAPGSKPVFKPSKTAEPPAKVKAAVSPLAPGALSPTSLFHSSSPETPQPLRSLQSPLSPQPNLPPQPSPESAASLRPLLNPVPYPATSSQMLNNHQPSFSSYANPTNLPAQGSLEPQGTSVGGHDMKLPLNKSDSSSDDFRVHIVTWNVGSAVPPDDITALFGPSIGDGSTDMFVIGLQEVNSMINKRLKDALSTDQWSELCMDTLSRFGYMLVASQRMQGVLLLVFSKPCHLPFLRGVQTQKTRTGLGGCWGNKGGVSARMMVFGHPVCFLNCHLPAHMRNLEQRMEDFESILQQQQFEGGAAVGVLDHDVVFWFGDLNFRIDDYDIHVVKSAIESSKLALLWERDQLNAAKNSEPILDGFMEGPLKFPPTYKFDVGTHTYDTSAKKRKPAWTDRILWRLRRTGSPVPSHNAALQRGLTSWLGGATRVTQHLYRSHMAFTVSDHKPVSALFSLHFPFKVNIPLVTLEVEKEWTKISDATVRLNVASSLQRSSWDWVGLYKVGFRHHKDYAAYVWAKPDHLTQVTFAEEDLPRDSGEYILGYYSNNMTSIVGVTEPFQVHFPVSSPPRCRSDSSEASSEDDSTLVLLGPSSRSPSPGTHTGKHRSHQHQHHRQRSRSPAVPTMSATPLPSLQSLSLCPRSHGGHTRNISPRPSASAKKERLVSPDTFPAPSVSPLSPRSPVSPGNGVSAPEALIAAILGEHRPIQGLPSGARPTCQAENAGL